MATTTVEAGGVEFVVAPLGGAAGGTRLVIVKPPEAIGAYRDLLARHDRSHMVELGIGYAAASPSTRSPPTRAAHRRRVPRSAPRPRDRRRLPSLCSTTFEVVFPHLRPGGDYVIEDWNHDHVTRRMLQDALFGDPSSPLHDWANEMMAGRIASGHDNQIGLTAIARRSLQRPAGVDDEPVRPLSRLVAQLAGC